MRLILRQLTKNFGGQRVLDSLDVDFGELRTLALIGPSGGGKSTLLRVIAGLETPDSGTVELDGKAVDFTSERALRAHRRRLGVVFQSYNLFPHLTALENLTLPLVKAHAMTPAAAEELALATLCRFGLAEHIQKRPGQLSGGQKQRVAIARAVAHRPALLLFDEPTSALDPDMTAEVLDAIVELKAGGCAFILVTHEMGFARHVADRVAFLDGGRIVEHGALFQQAENAAVRAFFERVLKFESAAR